MTISGGDTGTGTHAWVLCVFGGSRVDGAVVAAAADL
jgi:hypothetical protein